VARKNVPKFHELSLIGIMGGKIQKVEHGNKENSIVMCFMIHFSL